MGTMGTSLVAVLSAEDKGWHEALPTFTVESLGMELNRALSDIQDRPHRSDASSSQQQGMGLGYEAEMMEVFCMVQEGMGQDTRI